MRAWAVIAGMGCAFAGCGGSPGRPPTTSNLAEDYPGAATDGSHAPQYRVLTDAEVEALTKQASALAPGWTVAVDKLGFLAIAVCDVCSASTPAGPPFGPLKGITRGDFEAIQNFLHAEERLVRFASPFVVLKDTRGLGGDFFVQETPAGFGGHVRGERGPGGVVITGHAWPRLPPMQGGKSDADLEASLRKIDADPVLTFMHRLVPIHRANAATVELHAAVCLHHPSNVWTAVGPETPSYPSKPPCIDVFTGEDITELEAKFTVRMQRTVINSAMSN